ncbi:MAG TPA: heavy metal-associated domain-containing protein [Granulicella sp.]|jgi:copper chaperone|nr:heavy metal-associated domain-containing protein [Granulicella sp.]
MAELQIKNMHCGACIERVTETLKGIAGTKVEDVQIGKARIETEAEPGVILRALKEAGFPAAFE